MKDPLGKRSAMAQRCRRLVRAMGFRTGADFARWLKIDPRRWNNFEVGHPLSRDMVERLMHNIPGLTRDWLYEGKPDGLSVDLARRLGEIPDTVPAPKIKAKRA